MPNEPVQCPNCGSGDVRDRGPNSYTCEHCRTRFQWVDPSKTTVVFNSEAAVNRSEITPPIDPIVARAGTYYRNARYLIVALALFAGAWFFWDGYYVWPGYVTYYNSMTPERQAMVRAPHKPFDIQLQQELAIGLFVLAPVLLVFFLYRSRGSYRLEGNILHVPGHPPVPIDSIIGLDKTLWQRKGIALVEYQLSPTQRPSKLVLDDFIYQTKPTDDIVTVIESHLAPTLVWTRLRSGEKQTMAELTADENLEEEAEPQSQSPDEIDE